VRRPDRDSEPPASVSFGWLERGGLAKKTSRGKCFCCSIFFDNGEFDPGSERTLAAWIRHASRTGKLPSGGEYSGERVSNAWETCPAVGDNRPNGLLIPHTSPGSHGPGKKGGLSLEAAAEGWSRVPLACWWGNGLPRRRWVAGLRGCPATLGLRYGPDSYGRQQSRSFGNGRKPDRATPRERLKALWVVKLCQIGKKTSGPIPPKLDGTFRGSTG
jgi:hypothetical protein